MAGGSWNPVVAGAGCRCAVACRVYIGELGSEDDRE